MPRLDWIGKDKVVNHDKEVPFRVLEEQYAYNGDGDGNMIIHGDNLEALKALLPKYHGRVNCIYIDPPYNTGNEGWTYNDNVSDPKIKRWLNQVVGKEGEDLSRHDKWLCMMYPRLKLLHQLLANDGAILISIDDNEQANLKLLCDEIFGASNFVANVIWQKSKKGDSKLVAVIHEYILVYCKSKSAAIAKGFWRKKKAGADNVLAHYAQLKERLKNDHAAIMKEMSAWYKSLPKDAAERNHKHYKLSDDRGLYFAADFAGPNDGRESRPRYDILHPVTGKSCKKPSTGWRWEEEKTKLALAETPPRIHFGVDETTIPCRKSYLFEIDSEPLMSVFYTDGRGATLQVDSILHKKAFDFPKNVEVLEEWINTLTDKNSIVLDSFGGSGTTAHAVLNLNKQDNGNRKFILVEMMEYAETLTTERIKRVINGYGETLGTGGGFSYYTLGENLFKEDGNLNENLALEKIREYIFFSETSIPLPAINENESNKYYLGGHFGTGYYFYYEKRNATTLDFKFMATIKAKAEQLVIYADVCALSKQYLAKHNIIFKKIPRDIKRF